MNGTTKTRNRPGRKPTGPTGRKMMITASTELVSWLRAKGEVEGLSAAVYARTALMRLMNGEDGRPAA